VSDPNGANDSDSAAVSVIAHADLSISLQNSPLSGVVAGSGTFTTTGTVSNTDGPSDAHGYTVTFDLSTNAGSPYPQSLADVSFETPGGATGCAIGTSNDQVVCNRASGVAVGGHVTLPALTVNAASSALGSYRVTATVASTDSQTTLVGAGPTTTHDDTSVVAHASLSVASVTTSEPVNGVVAGDSTKGHYTATAHVHNGGPSDSHSYTVGYALSNAGTGQGAGDVHFVDPAGANGCTLTNATHISCALSNVAAGSNADAPAETVVATSPALGAYEVTATVSVVSPVTDTGSGPYSGHVDTTVRGETDLSASSANTPAASVIAGRDTFTTTPTVTNGGPSDSHAYTLTLHLATNPGDPNTAQAAGDVSFAALSTAATNAGCSLSGATGDVTCIRTAAQSISAGNPNTFTFPAITVNANHQALGRYSVQATATPTTTGVTDPNGSSMTPTSVDVIARATLTVSKSGTSFGNFNVTGSESANLVYANADATKNNVTYTITINAAANLSDARHVTITDDVNAGVAPTPNTPPAFTATICGPSLPNPVNNCQAIGTAGLDVGTMAPNTSRTYTVTAVANPALRSVSPNTGSPRGGYLVGTAPPASFAGNVANVGSTTPDFGGASYPKQAGSGNRAFIATVPNAPTNVQAFAGNANAGVSWLAPVQDGGQAITSYTVTAIPSSGTAPGPFTVNVPPNQTGFNQATDGTYQYQFNGLSNIVSYTFVVKATNPVGTGANSAASNPVSPSVNNSAAVFTNGGTQQTAAAPSSTDPQVESQTFNTGTTGLGTIQECTTSGSNACNVATGAATTNATINAAGKKNVPIIPTTFCGGAQCIGAVVITKLSNPSNGRYTILLQYAKQIIKGTGTSFKVYFMNPATQTSPTVLPDCPNKGTPTVPACVVKIVSQPALNPALKVQLSVAANVFDPVSGTRK
jgi:hypothetical protein